MHDSSTVRQRQTSRPVEMSSFLGLHAAGMSLKILRGDGGWMPSTLVL